MNQQTKTPEPPRGVMATIAAGFDLTTKHWGLLLLPIALDIFYWLGPRLRLTTLLQQLVAFWQEQAEIAELTGFDVNLMLDMAPRINLFTSLSVPFIGVPAFVASIMPEKAPFPLTEFEITNGGILFLTFLCLSIIGLFLTAVYYNLVAIAVQQTPPTLSLAQFTSKAIKNWLQLLAFCLVLLLAMFILYLPLAVISVVAALLSPVLALFILFMVPVLLGWLLIYFFFTPHGLILNGRSLWAAILESMMLIQQHLASALSFILAVIIIGQLLDWLLLLANDGSWFTIVSILAHAFVSTALVVASFIFYRERLARVVLVNNRFYTKKSTTTS